MVTPSSPLRKRLFEGTFHLVHDELRQFAQRVHMAHFEHFSEIARAHYVRFLEVPKLESRMNGAANRATCEHLRLLVEEGVLQPLKHDVADLPREYHGRVLLRRHARPLDFPRLASGFFDELGRLKRSNQQLYARAESHAGLTALRDRNNVGRSEVFTAHLLCASVYLAILKGAPEAARRWRCRPLLTSAHAYNHEYVGDAVIPLAGAELVIATPWIPAYPNGDMAAFLRAFDQRVRPTPYVLAAPYGWRKGGSKLEPDQLCEFSSLLEFLRRGG